MSMHYSLHKSTPHPIIIQTAEPPIRMAFHENADFMKSIYSMRIGKMDNVQLTLHLPPLTSVEISLPTTDGVEKNWFVALIADTVNQSQKL